MFPDGAQSKGGKSRTKRDFLTQHIIAELNELTADQVTKARALVRALITKAIDGDVPAIREVWDRVEGKVPQVIAGDADNPITIERIERVLVHPENTDSRSLPTVN
jgi:ribosomal protein L17